MTCPALLARAELLAEAFVLTFFRNRSTPKVTKPGEPVKAKANYGPQTSQRHATEDEVAKIRRGDWLRVDSKGRKPGNRDYRGHGSNRLGPDAAAIAKAKRARSN